MADLSAFSETYPQARQKFLDAAHARGASITSFRHDDATGPNGEPLFMDVARIGAADAPRVLVVGCGTHGIEGYSGSAAQTSWMSHCDAAAMPADSAVLLVHAHNPWGFAHALRFTEQNVDLNRNFVDFSSALPPNPGYAEVHELIVRPEWHDDEVDGLFARLSAFKDRVGEQAYSDAFNGGQYSHPDGIFYGGRGEQWSNRTFRKIVREHLGQATRAALIDLHTGIGPQDGHVFLCFHAPGSPAHERARQWWGERAVNREGVNHKAVARYQGLLVDAFCAMLPAASATAVVVEFGTLPRPLMQRASMAARWLWATPDADPALRAALMQDIRDAFYPAGASWRAGVLAQSKEIIDRGLAGIAHSD